MANAYRLFHKPKSEQTLYARITPSADQFKTQQARWNDLADFLKDRLKEDAGYPTSTWLQGSYKFDTQIRPSCTGEEFDIDLGLYFEWAGADSNGDYEPEGFKELVQNALLDYADDEENDATGVDDPKERCCRIKFKPDFHIDVPCYHLDRGDDRRTLATESKGWEDSDPKAIYRWFKGLFDDAEDRGQLRRQLCYFKMWVALKIHENESRPSSIMLTVLVAEEFVKLDRSDLSDDDDVIEQLIVAVADRLDEETVVKNPIATDENLNRLSDEAMKGLCSKLRDFEDIAKRANVASNEANAAEIWTEAFEQFFPMPEDVDGEEEDQSAQSAAVAKSTALVAYKFDPQVQVRAIAKSNEHWVREGVNSLPPIYKKCTINFRLLNVDQLPQGAVVRWMVRNKGQEAWNKNDIGHPSGNAFTTQETSAYTGKHAMDVTVYQHGRIIGRRRIDIDVRGGIVPMRNPPRRRFGR